MTTLRLKADVERRLVWSHPDSRITPFCSLCGGYIPEDKVACTLWGKKYWCAHMCEGCAEDAFEVEGK